MGHSRVLPGCATFARFPASTFVGEFRLKARRAVFAFLSVSFVVLAPLSVALAQMPVPASEPAPQVDISKLSAEERAEFLSRLSDEQVRELMLSFMQEQAEARSGGTLDQSALIEKFDQQVALFRERYGERLSHIGELPALPGLLYAKLAEGRGPYHPLIVIGLFIAITFAALGVERGYRWGARRLYAGLDLPENSEPLRRLGRLLTRLGLDLVGLVVFAAAVLAMFFVLHHGHEPTRIAVMTLLTATLIVRSISMLSRFFFAPFAANLRIAPFDDHVAVKIHRWMLAAAVIVVFGALIGGLALKLGVPEAQRELFRDLVVIAFVATIIVGALRLRKDVASALVAQIESDGRQHRFLSTFASLWHVAFIAYVVVVAFLSTFNHVIGEDTTAYPATLSLVILFIVPVADFFLRHLLDLYLPMPETGVRNESAYALPVFRRAARFLLLIFAVFLLGRVWGVNFHTLGQQGLGEEFMRAIVDISLTLLLAYVAWGVIKAALARYMPAAAEDGDGAGDEGGESSATRLETIMPLVMRFIQVTLAVIVVMILLASLGVNIGPLLAGAGVVGVAVGFGAQSLVRDVVSGLFFLMDDAFRKGEYVDIGNVKGTVEGINVRSLVLRHHLGPVHTVPYGEIQHLTNFSRDWVIMKLEFRVPTDTDINSVKKIFKQIGADMLEHPELGENFIEPFKSQGVKSIEDSAIIVRGKFKAKPGRQFVLRKELYNRVQKAFQENGIEFAHRKVTVELPPGANLSGDQAKQLTEAAGAAAIAAEEADRESQGRGGSG